MALAKHRRTIDWWEIERSSYRLVTSDRTEYELSSGFFLGQELAVGTVRRMAYLSKNASVDKCAENILSNGIVPQSEIGDAIQLAYCTVH